MIGVVVWLLGVHVKVTSSRSTCKMPTFRILTLRVAQGSALDWLVPVYSSSIHVLLVKAWTLLLTKLRKHALPNVKIVARVWWGVPLFVKNVQMQVSCTLKTSLLIALVVPSMKLTLQLHLHLRCLQR